MEDQEELFILQILVSTLTLSFLQNQNICKINRPSISIKIAEGPEVTLPYRSISLPDHLDNNVHNTGVYIFEKGKSCLFATNLSQRPNVKLQITVHDAVGSLQTAIGSSVTYEKVFDPNSLAVQTLIQGKVPIFSRINYEIGNVSLAITLQAIGSFRGENRLPKTSPQFEDYERVNATTERRATVNDSNNEFAMEMKTELPGEETGSSNSGSTIDYSDKFCSSSSSSRPSSHSSDYGSELSHSSGRKTKATRLKAIPDKLSKRTNDERVFKRISTNEKPKGWLRSAPVYKGNILRPPASIETTRSTLLKLSQIYPSLNDRVQDEVERKLKEKFKQLEEQFKTQKEKMRNKANKTAPFLRTGKIKQHKATQSNPIEKEPVLRENKGTVVGESLREDSFGSGSLASAVSPYHSEPSYYSASEGGEAPLRSGRSPISEGSKNSTEGDRNEEKRESNGENESEEPESLSIASLQNKNKVLKAAHSDGPLLSPRAPLQHQDSKPSRTTTSVYPETSEEIKPPRKPSPRGVDDVDETISSESARIAAVIIHRKNQEPFSSSISSYNPSSDFDAEDLSSLTIDENL